MYDLILKNCKIIDGSGDKAYMGDIAILNGSIAEIGNINGDSKEIADCEGFIAAPGFIDIHSHSDITVKDHPFCESRILQGVTTELCGNCGISTFPVSSDPIKRQQLIEYVEDLDYDWTDTKEFLDRVEELRPSVNFSTMVGHGSIRIAAMGFDDRVPDKEEMSLMKDILRKALEQGAFGMTSGLIYPPGIYSQKEELEELAEVLPEYGAFYATHMRDEGDGLIDSVKETIELAINSGASVEISHFKALGSRNWHSKVMEAVKLIEEARANGIDITCDQYPYTATATTLDSNIPPWAFEGGVSAVISRLNDPETRAKIKEELNVTHKDRWDKIHISYVNTKENQKFVGKSLAMISDEDGRDPADVLFDLIVEERSRVGQIEFAICEEDVKYIMRKPYVIVGSDGTAHGLDYEAQPHPREFGTFPRVLSEYAIGQGLFPLEEGIRKMTSMPAERIGLKKRGMLKKGYHADIVVFDPGTLKDTPTYEKPIAACQGIKLVYVNGILTAKDGMHTGARAGEILRRGQI